MLTHKVYDRKLAFHSSIRFFIFSALILVLISVSGYLVTYKLEVDKLERGESRFLLTSAAGLYADLLDSLGDLLLLAEKKRLFSGDAGSLQGLTQEFVDTARVRRSYHQLRLLNNRGMEIVRVNYDDGKTQVVSQQELQDKSGRYYFKNTISLKPGEVFVSRMDLNVEHGKIEKPFRPMIRFATPVTDTQGRRKGVLVLNFLADKLLGRVADINSKRPAKLMLLNKDGYWLYSENIDETWGFQLQHGQSFHKQYIDAWKQIMGSPAGQFSNRDGLFTFEKISAITGQLSKSQLAYSPVRDVRLVTQESYWYLVSHVDRSMLAAILKPRMQLAMFAFLAVLVFLVPVSYFWGRRHAQNVYDAARINVYANIIQNSDEMVYVVEPDGTIQFVNEAFERCTGYTAEEVIGKQPSLLKSGRHPDEFYKLLWETLEAGENFQGVFLNRKKDGSLFYEAKQILPQKNSDGKTEYYVSIGRDLSEIYSQHVREMEISSRLSESLPHHFNNLLNGILGYIQVSLMKIGEHDAEGVEDHLKMSLDAGVKATGLLAQIASASHKSLYMLPLVDLAEVVNNALTRFRLKLPENIDLTIHFDGSVMKVRGNKKLLEEAFLALLQNAAEALEGGGKISVTVTEMQPVSEVCVNCHEPLHGRLIQISISDDGEGIKENLQKRIFDPFFTTRVSGQAVAVTPGLGLTIVRGIAHLHGGHVLLHSREGEGTTVSILLPVAV